MVCQDAAIRELLLDVAQNGAAARTEIVKQMEDEAVEAATAEAARRLLEQRLYVPSFACRCLAQYLSQLRSE